MSEFNIPTADIAEQAIISTIFNDSAKWLPKLRACGVTAASFWTHRPIFDEMVDFIDSNGSIELTAFVQHLISIGRYDNLGGGTLIETIQYGAYSVSGWPKWVEQLQEAYALRVAYQLHQKDGSYEDSESAQNALRDALEAIVAAKSGPGRSANAKEATDAFIDHFIKLREAGDIPGRTTGIAALDNVSGGMRAGELWVIGGQTSRGKSVLMLQLAAEVMQSGERVAIFSLEMSRAEVVGRLVTVVGRIDYNQITKPREVTSKHDIQKIRNNVARLAEMNFWVDDTANQSLEHIAAESAMIRDTEGRIGLVVVDYLQLISGDRKRMESREQEVARISRGLKQLAKELGCPVISATQLNEQGQTRESRSIAQDADALLFIVEDGIKIGKLRNGRRDDVLPLILDGQFQRFAQR